MQKIYALEHFRPISEDQLDEDYKMIGFFSSMEKAQSFIEDYKKLPGFCEFPDNFNIFIYDNIDEPYQGQGFIMENDIPYWAKDEQPIGKLPKKIGRNIYILAYGFDNNVNILGVYSSRQKAEKAIERFLTQPYYKEYVREHFSIGKFMLNADHLRSS